MYVKYKNVDHTKQYYKFEMYVKLKCMTVAQKAWEGLIKLKYFKILGLLGIIKVIICIGL